MIAKEWKPVVFALGEFNNIVMGTSENKSNRAGRRAAAAKAGKLKGECK